MQMQGDDVAGRGGLFLSLIDGRRWTVETAMEPVGIALEAARDRHQKVKDIVGRYEDMIAIFRKFENSKSMAVLQNLRREIEARIDADLLDSLRICDLILACQGYSESAAHVAGHLIVIALRGTMSPADRGYRLQQAMGWAAIASGVQMTDADYVAAPDIASADLLGYRVSKVAGVTLLDPRLLQHSMRIDDEPVTGYDRYMPAELECGRPKRIFGTPHRWRWNGSSCEYPQSAAGLSAQVIAKRFPALADLCGAIIRQPDNDDAIRALLSALAEYPADTREEEEELTRLLAQMGDREALLDGACYLMRRAYHEDAGDEKRHSIKTILGLVAVASGARPLTIIDRHSEDGALDVVDHAGNFLIDEIKSWAMQVAKRSGELKAAGERFRAHQEAIDAGLAPEPDEQDEVEEDNDLIVASPGSVDFLARRGYVQICSRISDAGARDHKEISSRYSVLTTALKLQKAALPSHHLRGRLLAEFPHASDAINAIVSDLEAQEMSADGVFHVLPTLLLGAPGCGKSRLAMLVGELTKIAARLIPAGGVGDSHFAGLSRGWHSSMPSAPVELIRMSACPNPIMILDEIEKAALSRQNGSLIDAILPMLEPTTARSWLDPYLQSECDLSHVNWLFTANSLASLPPPFRDRVRVIEVPAPNAQHLPTIARSIVRELRPAGQHPGLTPDLDAVELRTILDSWSPGMSIRSLQRMVSAIIRARDEIAMRH